MEGNLRFKIGLVLVGSSSWKYVYHFCFVLLYICGQISKYKPLGGLYLEGRFNRSWVFCITGLGGLIFGSAYFQNFTVHCCLYKITQCCMDY